MANNNERIVNGVKTRVLHGRDYVEVAERVNSVYKAKKEFQVLESAPFEIAGRWVWRIVVTVDGKQAIGNAEVKLDAPRNTPDGTNPFECAETSAMGRALAFAGFGSVERIASYDEVARSQKYSTIVSPASASIVEASDAPKQIEEASRPDKERLNTLYDLAVNKQQLTRAAKAQDFIDLCAHVLKVKIVNVGQLTSSRLDTVEAWLNSIEDETEQQAQAS